MIEEGNMRNKKQLKSYLLAGLIVWGGQWQLYGQDQMPNAAHPERNVKASKLLNEIKITPDTVVVNVYLPEMFKNSKINRVNDKANMLHPVIERLHRLKLGVSDDTLRIVHIGDSHVRGRIFPQTAGMKLNGVFNQLIAYTDMGVNGATCLTFTHPTRIEAIAERQPELLILSFGTNESHNRRYNAVVHYHQLDELIKLLRAVMPDVPILLTTPPGSYESFRQRNRRRTYSVNPRTANVVKTIRKYANDAKLAVWDMFTIAGGKEAASENWWEAGLMRPDHVHFLPEAYVLHGELLYEAIINAYNDYVSE